MCNELEKLFKDLEVGSNIHLRFSEDMWRIDLEWIDNSYVFGSNLHSFAEKVKLKVGDTLVLFKTPSSGDDIVNVCLFSGNKEIVDDKRVCSERWTVLYNYTDGYVAKLEKMIERFNLRIKETIVFKFNDTNVLYGRIYKLDGKEIDYENRSVDISENGHGNWFWDVHWKYESDTEDTVGSEICGAEKLKNSCTTKSAPLFNRKNPLFVVVMDRDSMVFNEMPFQILPERLTVECSEKIPHNVKLMLPNGREIHVHFNRNEQCLSPMHEFINECKRLFGSTMVYSYEGSGKFLVHVLKEDFCEVDYFPFRTIPRAKVYDQDNINGIGWKFIVLATGTTIETGDINVWKKYSAKCEASFVKRENNRLSLLAWRKKNGGAIGNGGIRYSTGK
ncbi:hypothetical protein POM88_044853 [Heracleum sosnowskyi]|uniref:Uncharacterized protein n=1 Tax=Heracleum sosnowskyi TaxID=360622 RepID=A0AAD8M5K9_9APIA|nr:hypothetical protein POM88_044853 [Heracleum sosnowskyi]